MNTPTYIENEQWLQVERLPTGDRKLLRDLPMRQIESEPQPYTVEEGFETDFSSIPAIGRLLFRFSEVDIAGVVHDWQYREVFNKSGRDYPWNLIPFIGSQKKAYKDRYHSDNVWYLVAVSGKHHARTISAWLGWIALRGFGWAAWNNSQVK